MEKPEKIINNLRMTIRVGRGTLSFSMPDEQNTKVLFEPYVVKSGVSMPANLREAFKSMDFLKQIPAKARLIVDSDVLMVPLSLYDENESKTMYDQAFPGNEQNVLFSTALPDLNVVAVSSLSKDLKLVVDDHFQDVTILPVMMPVWNHLHQRSFTGSNLKLFGYFHERRLDVFCFQQNRFKFCNSYDVKYMRDAVFYLLYVWNQLQMNQQNDELHLVGDVFQGETLSGIERDELLGELRKYLQKVYVINPSADFNRAQVTKIKGMPYDLQTLFVKSYYVCRR